MYTQYRSNARYMYMYKCKRMLHTLQTHLLPTLNMHASVKVSVKVHRTSHFISVYVKAHTSLSSTLWVWNVQYMKFLCVAG